LCFSQVLQWIAYSNVNRNLLTVWCICSHIDFDCGFLHVDWNNALDVRALSDLTDLVMEKL
jgi:hypothetical protein